VGDLAPGFYMAGKLHELESGFDDFDSNMLLEFEAVEKTRAESIEKLNAFIEEVYPVEKDEYYHSVYGKTTLALDSYSPLFQYFFSHSQRSQVPKN